jgi:hypothetical protein
MLDDQTKEFLAAAIELHREMPAVRKPVCPRCCGMSWRRPLKKPCKCGGVFAPEEIKRVDYSRFSPIALAQMNDTARVVTR